jgi:hypothetical protein
MSDKTQAEIPFAVIEYSAVFEKPILEAWLVPARIIAGLLDALAPWGFTLDGVETRTPAKLNEYALIFRRQPANIILTLGIAKVTITVENPDWTEAPDLINGMNVALATITKTTNAAIQSQKLSWTAHIELKDKTRKEVTTPLLTPLAVSLLEKNPTFHGVYLQTEGSSILIDASVAYANGLFVKIVNDHSPDANLQHLAEVLRLEEQRLFEVLQLEGEL